MITVLLNFQDKEAVEVLCFEGRLFPFSQNPVPWADVVSP